MHNTMAQAEQRTSAGPSLHRSHCGDDAADGGEEEEEEEDAAESVGISCSLTSISAYQLVAST